MKSPQPNNLRLIEKTAKALRENNQEVIYIGGAVINLNANEERSRKLIEKFETN